MTPLLDKTKSVVHKTVKLFVANEYKLLFPDNFLVILFITVSVIGKGDCHGKKSGIVR
jgi:hypothetical protein